MEKSLQYRDRVGVQDFILLEDYTNIDAFVDNLKKRFKENLIYTSIGQVLISVNPYKTLPIYGDETIQEYRRAGFLETAPHVYAVADTSYRSLTEENRGQCILISGESGAGKTEASKKVLQFVAAASGNAGRVVSVKDKLLLSNPVLEAFGNAKTNKNDNSSRFGKYMDIAFDYTGEPSGGTILNYLLEKSRVVNQPTGERNFHIFYQLLAGADDSLLNRLSLSRERSCYTYLEHFKNAHSENDASQFRDVCKALETMELSDDERNELFSIVASVLHLGNVRFAEEEGISSIVDDEPLIKVSTLLGCSLDLLKEALTHRTIEARVESVTSPLTAELAVFARDALAKAIYDRLFTWLVKRLNSSIAPPKRESAVIGILDIYGFEVFQKNSFEQFCINLCNEKLQQLFIKLTLKQEQEEYRKEGIEWVQIEFFDNQVICDLIEEKHKGIISMMDEECLRPGEATDASLLAKMNKSLVQHAHYMSHEKSDIKTQKTMGRNEFRLIHYAGEVTYCVDSFLDKNSDLLFRDLCDVMTKTNNSITKSVFLESELRSKKRPETAMTKFHHSLNQLMVILGNKEPSYIRCIRPNDFKTPGVFDADIIRHQVKYLGLMENLRVRRAGFAYRRPYGDFLQRYKSLCPQTWPNFRGDIKQGVQILVNHLGYTPDEYRMGTTKLFIRLPNTLFKTEDAFQSRKHEIATIIQKVWKGRQQRLHYQKLRQAAISIERIARGFIARRRVEKRREAVQTIRKFITGFITRNGPVTDLNKKFVQIAKVQWLKRLSKNLPTRLLDRRWPQCPMVCEQASKALHDLHTKQLARKYRNRLSAERKRKFELKLVAESLFKDKKKTYEESFPNWFETDRVAVEDKEFVSNFLKTNINGEKLLYSTTVTKYDRHGYKPRSRVLLITNSSVYLLDTKSGKQKHKLAHKSITELVVTAGADTLLLVRIAPDLVKDKGDLILSVPYLIETVTIFVDFTKMTNLVKIVPTSGEIPHMMKGKEKSIQIMSSATSPAMGKNKAGALVVEG